MSNAPRADRLAAIGIETEELEDGFVLEYWQDSGGTWHGQLGPAEGGPPRARVLGRHPEALRSEAREQLAKMKRNLEAVT